MLLKIEVKYFNTNIIQVHAPTCGSDNEEIDSLYEQIQQILKAIKNDNIIFIISDFNTIIEQS